MERWWNNFKEKLPIFEDGDKVKLEDLAGCCNASLFSFAPEKSFREIENSFLAHRDLTAVGKNIRDFAAGRIKAETSSNYEE
jgi:hypothetical protein